jgi:MoxR-vWA-beta-propeller ternary system protein
MTSPLHDVCCASLPRSSLTVLAELRAVPDVLAALVGERAWVRWQSGQERVLRRLLPVAGVALYIQRGPLWHRFGCHLPTLDFPRELDYKPLHAVLFPAPVQPEMPPSLDLRPLFVTVAPDSRPRKSTALECAAADLACWADSVPAVRLAPLSAARCWKRLLVLGERLPPLPIGRRYWGETLLVPLGHRPEPNLPGDGIRAALGVGADELLLLDGDVAAAIPRDAFVPLTRARLRLAVQEAAP